MGSILDGLNPVNKIGSVQTDFKKSVNTFSTQGFKLTNNAKSNILGGEYTRQYSDEAVKLGGNTTFDKITDEILLQDKTGMLIEDGLGGSAWVPFGASANEAATALGALSNKKLLWKSAETVVNTLDLAVTGGTGSTVLRFGKGVSMTVNQAKAGVLGARIGFGVLNYRYNYGLDWGDAVITSTTSNVNLFTAYRLTKLLPKNKVTSYIGNTSHDAYAFIKDMNLFGAKSSFKFANFRAYVVDENIVNFRGKNPKGGRWDSKAFSLKVSPDAFYNRGFYELNKEMGFTPYNIFNGKFGVSDKQYYANKQFAQNQSVFDEAVASIDGSTPPNSKDYYKKVYGQQFMDAVDFFGKMEQAADPNAALDIYYDEKEKAENEGLNFVGRFMKFMPNAANLLENQRLSNQYSIMEITNMQSTLIKSGGINPVFNFESTTKAFGAVILYNAANIGLKVGSIALNLSTQVVDPIVSVGSGLLIRGQLIVGNTINAVANMFGVGVKPKPKPKQKESAKVSHTLVTTSIPYTYPKPGSDMISLDTKYIQRNIPIIKNDKQWEKREATIYLNNKRAEILKQLQKEKNDFSPSILGLNKKGRVPTQNDLKKIKSLEQQYIGISNYIDRVGTAIDKGIIKYDYKTNTFNNQKIW